MIIVVSDIFSNQMIGGAELTSDALLEKGFNNYRKINSLDLSVDFIDQNKDKNWIFFNFFGIKDKNILHIIKNIKNYSVIEYDYKYCSYRLKSKHEDTEGKCECENTPRGKLVALFLANSKNLFFMSQAQKEEYEKVYPILKKHKYSTVLSSSFKSESLKYILSLDTSRKNNKYLILNSDSWVKGRENCIKYAKEHKLEYELISGLEHLDLLKKLADSKGLIFLPNGYDTCPRLVIEAKLLDCDVILNDNVQHKDESWYKDKATIKEHIKKQKELFYNTCLKNSFDVEAVEEKTRFVFIMPGYNVSEWLPRCIDTIKKQEYDNFLAVFIDDLSNDNSFEIFKDLTIGDNRFVGIKNVDKKFALKNINDAIEDVNIQDDDVIILLDADDWLTSSNVLQYLNNFYLQKDCLATYGSYMYYPHGFAGIEPSEYPKEIIENNDYRNDKWRASHLRTFKKKVWDKIEKSDFVDNDGEYYKMAYDQAIMLPILEMVGPKAMYIPNILHVYNVANNLNVSKIKKTEQHDTMLRIRNKKKYERVNFEN